MDRKPRVRRRVIRAGEYIGRGKKRGFVVARAEPDKHKHVFWLVFWDHPRNCPVCHGKPTRHRADYLLSGRVVSCGIEKIKNYKAHLVRQWGVDIHGKDIPKTARKRT
jgi:hypothetical protein